jgi:hypothetical protein
MYTCHVNHCQHPTCPTPGRCKFFLRWLIYPTVAATSRSIIMTQRDVVTVTWHCDAISLCHVTIDNADGDTCAWWQKEQDSLLLNTQYMWWQLELSRNSPQTKSENSAFNFLHRRALNADLFPKPRENFMSNNAGPRSSFSTSPLFSLSNVDFF